MFRRTCIAVALSLSLATGLTAAAPAARARSAMPADDRALVDEAASYIQDLRSVEGRFVQANWQGTTSTGLFYMERPGRARFQYDPNGVLLVVADGRDVNIYDQRLKSFQHYPLARTPLNMLLAPEVRLDRGVVISRVDRTADGFSITAQDPKRRTAGSITLFFSSSPVALQGWTVVDAQGRATRVRLSQLRPVANLDPALFVLRDPHARARRR